MNKIAGGGKFMKLSVSNIAWTAEQDTYAYDLMKKYGYCGLEVAPTRIFLENPYNKKSDATAWLYNLRKKYGFFVSSMQSIWFGRTESMFKNS